MKREGGFTLIELIVVIAVLGILAMMFITKFTGIKDDSVKRSMISEAKGIYTTIASIEAGGEKPDKAKVEEYMGRGEIDGLVVKPDGSFIYEKKSGNRTYVIEGNPQGFSDITLKH